MPQHKQIQKLLIEFILLLLTITCVTSDDGNVAGSSTYILAWNRLLSSFTQFHYANFTYQPNAAALSIQSVEMGTAELALTDLSLDEIQSFNQDDPVYDKFTGIPFLGQTYALVYNIENYTNLILDTNIICGIFLEKISTWNHPDIVALNPGLATYNKSITNVVRNLESISTLLLSKFLTDNCPEWKQKYGPALLWPDELENVSSTLLSRPHEFSVYATVATYPYSITIAAFPFFYSIGFARGINFAGFKTPSGAIIYPNDPESRDTVQNFTWSDGAPIKFSNAGNLERWPFVAFGHIMFKKDFGTTANCSAIKDLVRYVRWAYTDPSAHFAMEFVGYYFPLQNVIDEAVKLLDSAKCNNVGLLTIRTDFNTRPGIVAFNVIFWVLIVVSAILLLVFNRKSLISIVYAVVLIIGMIFCGISMIFFALEPRDASICALRKWCMGLGLIIFSGGVFFRSYQLKRIHDLVKSGKYKKGKKIDHLRLAAILISIVVGIELIILIVLQTTVPHYSQVAVLNQVDRLGEFRCASDSPLSWLLVQSIYLGLILVMGVVVLYTTWNIASNVDDTRINIMMMFICILSLVVVDVILRNPGLADYLESWYNICIIFLWSISMMCSVYLPKIVKSYYKSSGTGSGHSTTQNPDRHHSSKMKSTLTGSEHAHQQASA